MKIKTPEDTASELFERIKMPMDVNQYETTDQIRKLALRAYFMGVYDTENLTPLNVNKEK